MIRDGVWAGLLPEHLLEIRLTVAIETATSTCPSALDEEDKATAKLYVQKAAQAADEAWQHTIGDLQGPGVTKPTIASLERPRSASEDKTVMMWTSHRPGRADSVRRSSKRSFRG